MFFVVFFVFLLIWQIICWFDKWKKWFCCYFIQNIRSLENIRSLALLSESRHFITESEISHWNRRKTGASFALNHAFLKEWDIVFFPMMLRQQNLSHNPRKLWACGVVDVGAYCHTLSGYSLSQKSQNPQKWAIGSLRLSRLIGLSAHICAFCESYSYHRAM